MKIFWCVVLILIAYFVDDWILTKTEPKDFEEEYKEENENE